MILIDAFNVLHLPRAAARPDPIELADLAALIGIGRYAGRRAVLVCDGDGGARDPAGPRGRLTLSGVEVVFSGPDRSADDDIEDRLRRAGGHGVVVVSDDRRIRRAAAKAGAKTLASGVFLSHLLADRDRPRARPAPRFTRDIPLDRYSVAHWMRQFGLSPRDLLERRAGRAEAPGNAPTPQPPAAAPAPASPNPPGSETPLHAPSAAPDSRVLRMESLADDPVIREALEAWKGRLTLDDLDMARWLSEHPPGDKPRRPRGNQR